MGNLTIKTANIERRIIEFLREGWVELPQEEQVEIERAIRLRVRAILEDELDSLVLY